MKKILGILVLGLLLIINVAQAKTIDAGNGITLDIPTNYKYFEINYKKLKSLLVTFPNLKKQINSKDFKESLKLIGIGNNSKLTILVENQKALELIKKASTPSGLKDIIKEYEDLVQPFINEYIDEKFTPDIIKKLEKMSEKKAEKWIYEWYEKPTQVKFLNQLATRGLELLSEKYKLHKYALIMTMDKKMNNDIYNYVQTIDTNKNIKKEISNYLNKSPMYKDYSSEFNMLEVGKNSNNDSFLYAQVIMKNNHSEFNSEGELFLSSKNEKIILAGTTCFENCDDFLKIIYEIFEPMGLLAKNIENKVKTTDDNNNITQQLKDLNEMYESGALTKEEFEKAKKKLLN